MRVYQTICIKKTDNIKKHLWLRKPSKFRKKQIFHLEDLMVMYGIYNSDPLEKLINTVHKCIIK